MLAVASGFTASKPLLKSLELDTWITRKNEN